MALKALGIPEELAIVLSSLQLRGTSPEATEITKRLQCEYFWRNGEQSRSTPSNACSHEQKKLHVRTKHEWRPS